VRPRGRAQEHSKAKGDTDEEKVEKSKSPNVETGVFDVWTFRRFDVLTFDSPVCGGPGLSALFVGRVAATQTLLWADSLLPRALSLGRFHPPETITGG
jgi:hypothetical protein